MYSTKIFIKDDLKNNHWVGHSVVKPVGVVAFQKIKAMREGKNDESKNFEMGIIDEGALYKAFKVPGNTLDRKTWKKNYEVIDDEYVKQLDV